MAGNPKIAVIGAGLGGTVAATLLTKAKFDVRLYEQAECFSRLGAGIHLGPNVTRIMREVGIEDELNRTASHPDFWYSRDGVTGEICAKIPLGDYALKQYGSTYLTVHRGDFQQLLTEAVPAGILDFNKKLQKVDDLGDKVVLEFTDGTVEYADLVIGADGVNSVIRESLLGPELPQHTGYIAHRAVFNTPGIQLDLPFDMCTKWWGDDRHMMVYYVTKQQDQIYFVTGVPGGENWDMNKRWVPSTKDELREAFRGWHPTVQALIEGADEITLWPLLELAPLPLWSRGRLVLLGDACHPMKPHMGQGAAMAIEDAAMLTRCLIETGPASYEQAFKLYEKNRTARTARVQSVSHDNTWLRTDEDPDWCFGYDVFSVPLVNI
ncbi:FAD-dependent monooxygenase [Pusillimonas noertemannii]|uniref:FAD-dependent monooxygenase n=1 Tax=Pusillimonas noertemannii TaxID=305977 RepID=UPI0002E0FA9E|nr:FAD-dependent monooxygenase [Pusillimonas noertemannii]